MKTFVVENPFGYGCQASGLIVVSAEDLDKAKKLIKKNFEKDRDVDIQDIMHGIREIEDDEVLWVYDN